MEESCFPAQPSQSILGTSEVTKDEEIPHQGTLASSEILFKGLC